MALSNLLTEYTIDETLKKSLKNFRDKLIGIYPNRPVCTDVYNALSEYVCKVDEQLIYIAYELFLLNAPLSGIDQTIVKYILSNNYSEEEQLRGILFVLYTFCIRMGSCCTINIEILLDMLLE